ncbi:MAG: AAA family ATPase, partial [Oscillospiraceae bacterium]|nr:AAA family ATPase [Oscillospiraceae bacterium]
MLLSLHIENITVIEQADIGFNAGFNVLTGETGAGKSIIIDSLNAVLGERISRDIIRTGCDSGTISAIFGNLADNIIRTIAEMGYTVDEEGQLLISRQISADGKTSCRINGRPATVSVLRELGRMLVNAHGQHENQVLLMPDRHVDYLDKTGGLMPLREEYAGAFSVMQKIKRQLAEADFDEAMKLKRIDLLTYQIGEIEAAEIKGGEEEPLMQKRSLFRNAEKITSALYAAHMAMNGDEDTSGLLSALNAAVAHITDAGRYHPPAAELSRRLS